MSLTPFWYGPVYLQSKHTHTQNKKKPTAKGFSFFFLFRGGGGGGWRWRFSVLWRRKKKKKKIPASLFVSVAHITSRSALVWLMIHRHLLCCFFFFSMIWRLGAWAGRNGRAPLFLMRSPVLFFYLIFFSFSSSSRGKRGADHWPPSISSLNPCPRPIRQRQ